jgi:hypothetical protein
MSGEAGNLRAWRHRAGWIVSMLAFAPMAGASGADAPGAPVALKETITPDLCTQVRIELKAEGLFRPGLPPDAVKDEARMPKPLSLDVKTRLVFHERVFPEGTRPGATKGKGARAGAASAGGQHAVRWVSQAASAINGEVRPTANSLRRELNLLVADRSGPEKTAVVVSAAGPMTRAELELVQGLADPLTLPDLLPADPVTKGATWKLPSSVALSLTGYDAMTSNTLEATLESIDAVSARVKVKGEVQGSVLGGKGTMTCDGFFHVDREAGLIDRLEVSRTENRQPGPVEAGLEVKSTLTLSRRPASVISELADAALADLPLEISAPRRLLQLISPDGKYNLLHDRNWHLYWDDPRLTVLKRLENGQVLAQCNLAAGPNAGKGKHQDPSQFRDDIKKSLKDRFVQFVGAGEVEGDEAGGYRYKVSVQGREGELGVLWHYFLIASPRGDQLLATFTLAAEDAGAFAGQDLELIGSLQWFDPPLPSRR